MPFYKMNHADRLIEVFDNLWGPGHHLNSITDEFKKVLRKDNCNIPLEIGKTVSRTLQNYCKDCKGWNGKYDLFYMPEGKGKGHWAVRQENVDAYIKERDTGGRGGRVSTDPVRKEALAMATDFVKNALRKKGHKLANVDTGEIKRLTLEAIANNPGITKEAERRVDERSKMTEFDPLSHFLSATEKAHNEAEEHKAW